MNKIAGFTVAFCLLQAGTHALAESPAQWYADGQATIQAALALRPIETRAKNVVLFVGDGMGISTITATRIFDGQLRGASGEENRLSWESLPYVALSKTYNTNLQTPDSAGTMSAMMTGIKTGHGLISVNQNTRLGDCGSSDGQAAETFLEQAERVGMATGIVSTARITHATPAATYAHSASRDWESDRELSAQAKAQGCKDIARQLVEFPYGDGPDVILGGGRRNFLGAETADPEYPGKTGVRVDGRNLIEQWQHKTGGQFVWNGEQLAQAAQQPTGKLLGLFSPSHMAYELDRAAEAFVEPSLTDMTRVAIQRLAKNDQGFFLMVEAGRIDHAHHAGNAARALADGKALQDAVAQALSMLDLSETLVIVTADHSHVFTLGGYPARGNPILGFVHGPSPDGRINAEPDLAADGKPYTTLGYLNGPGFDGQGELARREGKVPVSGRHLSAKTRVTSPNYFQEALVPLASETHGGEDVAIYAGGPWAHLFHQTHEQNYIYHVMRYAAQLEQRAKPENP